MIEMEVGAFWRDLSDSVQRFQSLPLNLQGALLVTVLSPDVKVRVAFWGQTDASGLLVRH